MRATVFADQKFRLGVKAFAEHSGLVRVCVDGNQQPITTSASIHAERKATLSSFAPRTMNAGGVLARGKGKANCGAYVD
jgi:hypothetical protein